jgi:hypothetical protein
LLGALYPDTPTPHTIPEAERIIRKMASGEPLDYNENGCLLNILNFVRGTHFLGSLVGSDAYIHLDMPKLAPEMWGDFYRFWRNNPFRCPAWCPCRG